MRRNNNNECSIVESNNETEKEMNFFLFRETLIKEILASMVGWFSIYFSAVFSFFFFFVVKTVIAIKRKF